MAGAPIAVFAYGSLMRDPELPEAVVGGMAARLPGYVRAMNKRSRPRGCPASRSFADHPAASRAFRGEDGHCDSLALGTERRPGRAMRGWVHLYPPRVCEALLSRLDAREGYRRDANPSDNGYLRRVIRVESDGGVVMDAIVYLTNDARDARWFVPPEVSADLRARVLIAATPCVPDAYLRGVDYLADSVEALADRGLVDPELDALVAAVARYAGPWRDRLPDRSRSS